MGNQKPWGRIYSANGEHTDIVRYRNYSLKIGIHRLNLGNLNSFVFQSSNAKRAIDFWSLLILWLGELKSSTTIDIEVLNTSGWDPTFLDAVERFIDSTQQFLLGNHELGLESAGRVQSRRHKG